MLHDFVWNVSVNFCLSIQLQILLPLGHIEVDNLHDPKDIEEAILVPRKTIKQLNSKIRVIFELSSATFVLIRSIKQASGAAKTAALERSVRFREGKLEVAKWHLQKVTLELRMLKDELKHVEKLPVCKNNI